MKSNSRVLRGWRDFGVKATAIILTILLATQMVGTPAFATATMSNKQASEDIATTVDDTGVELSGTEATDTTVPDEAAGAANEPAPADSTQATEEPVAETAESATEPATETPAADPAASTVLGAEPEPASDSGSEPAPAVEQDQLASIELNLADGASITLSKDGNKIDDDTNPVDVPANEELKFTAQAAEGWQVDKVKTVIDGVETELTADANGEYKIAADKVTDKLTVKVEASAVESETPSEGEEASTEEGAARDESVAPRSDAAAATRANSARAADYTIEVGETIEIHGKFEGLVPQHKWSVDSGTGQVKLSNTGDNPVAVTGVAEGTVTLKHEYWALATWWDTKEQTISVQITPAATVNIVQDSLEITLGDYGQLTATATPEGSSVTWSSSDERVATVDQDGCVTTHQTGVATITARSGRASDTATIYVVSPATYRLVYNSNYPDDAKKIVYENGDAGNITLEDAVETNAVYTYEPGTSATIAGDMTLANYEFLGWSTDPNATKPDSAYNPGAEVVMESNLTLYAVWGNKIEIGNQVNVTVRYYKSENGRDYVGKDTVAFESGRNGQRTYTFVLGNNQDTIESDSPNLRGWQHDGKHYAFNETITTSEYRTEGHGGNQKIVIEVRPWFDDSATYAQFFVLKADDAAYGDKGNYYSVGTGSIDAEIFKSGSANVGDTPTYPNGIENKSNNISELIISAPSPTQIASALNVSLDEAQTVRWYVAKSQSDGYHVDGVIYRAGVYHNVRFVDTATGEVMASYVVEDMGTVLESQIPDTSSLEDFECWVDESGKVLTSGNINLIGDDLTFYTKYKDKYNVTASIVDDEGNPVEGATATPSAQSVTKGQQSEAISFAIPDGYKIEKITVNGQDQTGDNAGKTEYAYPSQTVNGDITIVVQVARTYEVKYSWSGLKGSNPWTDGEGTEHKATLPNDGAAYEVTAGETFEVDKTYAAGATFENEYGTWTFSGWSTGDFEVTGDKEITGTWTIEEGDEATYEVKYSWSGLKGSNPWTDGEGTEHKATLPNDGAAYEVTAGETFEVDKTYAAGATFENEYGTWTFSGWSTGDFEVTGDKEITGTWTIEEGDEATYEVKYSWSGLKGSNPWTDGEGTEHKATLPNDGAAYEVTAGETFEVDKTYAAGATFENEYGTWTFSGWSTGDFEVTGDKEITGTWTLTSVNIGSELINVSTPTNVPYNGADQTWAPTVTDAEGNLLAAGEDYEVSYSTEDRTNVTGTITVTITGMGDYAGTVTRTYQITPVRVAVNTQSASKVYDGTPLTAPGEIVTLVNGETATVNTSSITEVGSIANDYEIAWNGTAKQSNYTVVSGTIGTLTITAAPVPPTPDTPTPDTPTPTPLPTPDPTPTPGTTTPVPTPGPGDGDATPADPTDEAEATIDDEATPLTAPEPIDDNVTPMASGAHRDCWVHWLMLLGILVTVVYYGGVGVRRVRFSSSLQSFEDDVLGNDETNR